MTATDCQLASLSQRPERRGGLEVAVASGGPALRAIELRPGSGRFGTPPRRAPGHGGAVRRAHPSAARLGAEPRRAQPAHHRPAARHDGVRVRLAAGVVAPGHRCSLSAWLPGGSGAPVRVVQRC